jgi:putative methyltransferase (TIGR04325 family)
MRLSALLESTLSGPVIGRLRARRFERFFKTGAMSGICRGVYATRDEAGASAPRTMPLGYDHPAAGDLYRERLEQVYPGDYPMMHWLAEAFAAGVTRVFDLGGHVGVSYYSYQRYLKYPDGLRWELFDVPAVAARGRALAAERDARGALSFVDDLGRIAEAELLFTSGCLQYLEESLPELLARQATLPPRVLMNLIPLHPEFDFWTVQSIDHAFCPYHLQRDAPFFTAMERLGYRLVDRWINAEKRCVVKFRPEHSVQGYVGAAFRLAS